MDELRNVCTKITLLQGIKEIPIFAKTIKELSTQRSGRKKRYKKNSFSWKVANIMMGKMTIQKYLDPGSPIVNLHINGIEIPNTLNDLGVAINIMIKQVKDTLTLPSLQYTPTSLQLADRSVIKLHGVLEDVCVSLDSW